MTVAGATPALSLRALLRGFPGVAVNAPAAASCPLGLIHGHVGVHEQGRQVAAGQVLGNADAGGVGERLAAMTKGTGATAGQLFGHLGRSRARDPHDDDDELIAAVTAHNVVGPHLLPACLGYLLKHLVAGDMAVRVVDLLEVVHVEARTLDWGGARNRTARAPNRSSRSPTG